MDNNYKKRLSELTERAEDHAAKANSEGGYLTTQVSEMEEYRDATRLYTRHIAVCVFLSLIMLAFAHGFTLTRPIGEAFLTTVDGKVMEVVPALIKPR